MKKKLYIIALIAFFCSFCGNNEKVSLLVCEAKFGYNIFLPLICGEKKSKKNQPKFVHPTYPSKKEIQEKFKTVSAEKANTVGCLSCHNGIENFREEGSMMKASIQAMGKAYGDPGGCVVCHGGQPKATSYEEAHKGFPSKMKSGPKNFYPDPGSLWIARNTCGQSGCHVGYVDNLEKSLMNTEAGKIQGNLHTWGIKEVQNYNVPWGNYDIKDEDGSVPTRGTEEYKKYMAVMTKAHPKQFPKELKQIPLPTVEEIEKDPKLAGFTYQRQQCQRCHVSVKGREKRGDYRGMGCSSCHILYSNDGYYEGNDPTIDKNEKGHLLTHEIKGTRKSGGIPVETCNSCHNRGKRIGTTYQGLMEFPYGSPFGPDGNKQPKLHTKKYLFISDDLHHQFDQSRPGNPIGGMLCQDCHTTIDMHGDGNIFGTTLAQVEIECQDCHGTPDKYPWELPLGFSEEFAKDLTNEKPRGLGDNVLPQTQAYATLYDRKDGYLLSARGNPLGNVVKDGEKVVLHSATGNDFEIPVLKTLNINKTWSSPDAEVAMAKVKNHNRELECYACHASWVPQCYGCHVKMDYSKGKDGKPKMDIDWITSGSANDEQGQTAESTLGVGGIKSMGKAYETRSYLRWEEPVLGRNGEGRITPLMPGCQVIFTVIGRDGKTLINNMIGFAEDEAKAANQKHKPLLIDMAPAQPHSAQRKARTCESCHDNAKAAGYGIGGGVFQRKNNINVIEDLLDQRTGEPIPKRYQVQIPAIPNLNFDLSAIVDRKTGNQIATVGTHWPLSRALNRKERSKLERTGLCLGCHQEMTNKELWNRVNSKEFLDTKAHTRKMNEILKAYYKLKKEEAEENKK